MSHTIISGNGWSIVDPDDMSTGLPSREVNDNFMALEKLFSSTVFASGKIPVGNCVLVDITSAGDTVNATSLQSAYDYATVFLDPTPTNRAWIIIPPGRYDFGSAGLLLNTDCIDLIGFNMVTTWIASTNAQAALEELVIPRFQASVTFAAESNYEEVTVTDAIITSTSKLICSFVGDEEIAIQNITCGVKSVSNGSCILFAVTQFGATWTYIINLGVFR